jgi:tetratricopeptide (TPR) repeat protein
LAAVIFVCAGCAAKIDAAASREKTALAQRLEREGKGAEAETAYREALKADKFNETAYHGLARVCLNRGEPNIALPLLEKAARYAGRTGPADAAAQAAALIITGRPAEASHVLEEVLDGEPGRYDLRLLLAVACYKNKQFARAAYEIGSIPAQAAGGAAESPAEKAAVDLGLDAVGLKVILLEVWTNYLRSLERDQWTQEAEETAARAEQYFPEAAHFKAYLARLRYLRGERAKADELMGRALAMGPFDMEVVREARYIYVCERKYAEALAVWRRVVPQSLVWAQDNKVKPALDGLETFTREAAEKKDDAVTQFLLARAYRRMGWIEEAEAQVKAALALDAGYSNALNEMLVLVKHKRYLARIKSFLSYVYDEELSGGGGPSLNEIVSALRQIAQSEGIVLQKSSEEVYSLPFYGREIHVFNRDKSGLAAYFVEFGEYLHVSQIYEPAFCQIMNIIAWFDKTHGMDSQCVLCDEDRVRGLAGYAANRSVIAGHSTLSAIGFYVDFDGLRPDVRFAANVKAAAQVGAANSAQVGFYSDAGREALLARILKGVDVSSKDAVFQRLSESMFDNVAFHEFGHVKDIQRFQPLYAHIPAHVIEGFRSGFSPAKIRDRMELRAEAYSLAHSPAPHGVILNNLFRLQYDIKSARYIDYLLYYMSLVESDYGPYMSGAERVLDFARRYVEEESKGQITPQETAARLSEASPVELSKIGRALLKDEGMN